MADEYDDDDAGSALKASLQDDRPGCVRVIKGKVQVDGGGRRESIYRNKSEQDEALVGPQ